MQQVLRKMYISCLLYTSTVFVHSFLAVVRRMVKFDSLTAGAARFPSGITGAVSFWIGLTGRGAAGVVVGAVFCLSSGWTGEAGGTIWRSALTGGVCS